MQLFTTTFSTRFGLFSLAVDQEGAVVGTAFGGQPELRKRLPSSVSGGLSLSTCERRTAPARLQVLAYAEGNLSEFDLPLAPVGSAFQQRVWAELRRIPWGQTRTYGDISRILDSSPRAVGRANATNPVCLVIPCHRVIGADGSLTGFAFGQDIKQQLLAYEHARAVANSAA